MTTPVDERPEPTYGYNTAHPGGPQAPVSRERSGTLPSYNINSRSQERRASYEQRQSQERSSDEEGTLLGEGDGSHNGKDMPPAPKRDHSHLTVETQYEPGDPLRTMASPSQTREQAHRLDDDLAMLKIERQASKQADDPELTRSGTRKRDETVDEFDVATNPVHEKTQTYKPVENPTSNFAKFIKKVHKSNWVIRYITYIAPLTFILLIPLLLGVFLYKDAGVGGVQMYWFIIWLEIVWLTLWLGRIIAKSLPWPIGLVATLFTNNGKKWRDMGKQLELPATLFFWWLAIEISFLPTMTHHQLNHTSDHTASWMKTMNKVLVSIFVGAILNFIEKIIIQLIAISFHLRTYADRIELNKFQIGSLAKLYKFSKEKIAMEDSEFEAPSGDRPGSGAMTPGALINEAAKQTKEAFSKFGDVAGKVAGDFTGKAVTKSTHPNQVVLMLLSSVSGSQVLARRLYRTFARPETETVNQEDLTNAFENEDEATAAFSMFDKDMNGDISMEELEAVCVEIGRERKSITASLKDLDSVVGKLDDMFMFIVAVVVILVFISLISTSAAGVLTSAGSAVLALSWLFSATAQEFLQSVIFVFVKHPFDVGDRVSIYGNTGALGRGDDYFVKEISLLYTEFKKMEGHVVQAPNSYLNTLFILNQRRSGGLAEAVSITIKFGTTLDQIDGLRTKLLEFVKAEKREYQGNILTELRDIVEVHSMNLNVVFFYKSNWQNEGLRLARRNKFICAMMVTMQEMGIEGPYMRYPGMKQSFPMYLQSVPHVAVPGMGYGGHPDNPGGFHEEDHQDGYQDPPFVPPVPGQEGTTGSVPATSRMRSGSILRNGSTMRPRGESLAAMNKRVDFSLGMKNMSYGDDLSGDVYEDRNRGRIPISVTEASRSRDRAAAAIEQERISLDRGSRGSADIGRTSSRDFQPHGLLRRSTDSSARNVPRASMHRNRFFGRSRPNTGNDEMGLMENGMADIPENPSTSGSNTISKQPSRDKLDPRSGMVSPAAWRTVSNESNISPDKVAGPPPGPPRIPTNVIAPTMAQSSGALGNRNPTVEDAPERQHQRGLSSSQTNDFADNYEMRNLR